MVVIDEATLAAIIFLKKIEPIDFLDGLRA
jgi:hypothetical protein